MKADLPRGPRRSRASGSPPGVDTAISVPGDVFAEAKRRARPRLAALRTIAASLASVASSASTHSADSRSRCRAHSSSAGFALSVRPNIVHSSARKKQTTLPSLEYPGRPYHAVGRSPGALRRTSAWMRSPMARWSPGIAAIFARAAGRPSAYFAAGLATFLVVSLPASSLTLSSAWRFRSPVCPSCCLRSGRARAERDFRHPDAGTVLGGIL
jgi:hypothetical protein